MSRENQLTAGYKRRSMLGELWHQFKKHKGAMIGLFVTVALILLACLSGILFDYETDVIAINAIERLQPPSMQHFFGTDQFGRDIFSRVCYGTRYSIIIGFVSTSISLLFGLFFGSIAGYYGGKIENLILRAADVVSSIPTMMLAILIVSALGSNMLNLMVAVGLASIPDFIRITRASVLSVRNQEYIESARAIGLHDFKIIRKHVIPNCLAPIIVQSTLQVGSAVIASAGLSFLGLGIPAPDPEWGSMLSAGRDFIRDYSYITVFPGMMIMITVLALNMIGDGLRDALDPKLRK